jgi:aurora kinase
MTSKPTVHSLTRQLSEMDINGKPIRTNLQKQPTQAKLLSKFAPSQQGERNAPMSAAVRMALAGAQAAASKTAQTKSATTSSAAQPSFDIGKYDGGFELENEKRGSKVYGEAAEELALDSSQSRYVCPALLIHIRD